MISANYEGWPVVRVTVSTSGTDEESQARLRDFHVEVRTRGAACVLIFDLQDHEKLSAERREMITDTLLMLDARDFIVACALVCNGLQGDSNLSRKFWARPPSYPLRFFPFLHEVDEWVSMLTSDHHPAPANEGETLERAPLTREEEHVHDPLRAAGRLQFDDDLMRDPGEGAWIIHFDASLRRARGPCQTRRAAHRLSVDRFVGLSRHKPCFGEAVSSRLQIRGHPHELWAIQIDVRSATPKTQPGHSSPL